MENPIKMDDLGVPLFSETSILLRQKKSWRRILGLIFKKIGQRKCLVLLPTNSKGLNIKHWGTWGWIP